MSTGISDKDLSRIRELVAVGRPIDATTVQVLLEVVDTLRVGGTDVTRRVPVLILEGEDDRETDKIPDAALHPVVRATAGVFERGADAPSSLRDLPQNAWEERAANPQSELIVEFIDAGIFNRHMTGDHPAHSFGATRVFDGVARGIREGFSTVPAIAEVVYVLSSVANSYRLSREQIRDTVLPLLLLDHLHVERKQMIADVFDWYTRIPADFVDRYHAVLARELGLTGIVTFDTHFRLFPFVQTRRS